MSGSYPFKRIANDDELIYRFDEPISRSHYDQILHLLRQGYGLIRTPLNGTTAPPEITEVRVPGWMPHRMLSDTVLDGMDANVARVLRDEEVPRTVLYVEPGILDIARR